MSDPLIRSIENYLILEPGKPEKFLTKEETLIWLENWLKSMEMLPEDLRGELSFKKAALRLLETACDLEVEPGLTLQWFAVRLEPPNFKY